MSLLKKKQQLATANAGNNGNGMSDAEQILNAGADSEITLSRSYSGRAELRHHNQILKIIIVLQVIMFCYGQYAWVKHSNYLAEKRTAVIEVDANGKAVTKSLESYQPREPLEQEIKYQGGMFIYWLQSAGSADIDRCFVEARRMAHTSLTPKLDEIIEKVTPGIKELRIYRRIENLKVKTLETSDLETPTMGEFSRYDVLVTGDVLSYRLQNNELSDKRAFAYHVRLVPLSERSDWNPSALLVQDFEEVKLKK
jgi:hypothetical protein